MTTATLERQETLTATVTIAYVNPPKAEGKPGNIRDSEGQYYSIWTPGLLEQFQPGETCYVDYRVKNGFRTVLAKRPVVQAPRQQQPQQQRSAPVQQHVTPPNGNGNGNGHYRPTHPRDSERMFVCSTLNAFIQTGRIGNDVTALTETVEMLRQVYHATFGQDDPAIG